MKSLHKKSIHLLMLNLITALLLLAGCAVNPVTGDRELALVPVSTEQEIALGKEAFPQALQQMGGEYPDESLNAYVNRVGKKLAQASHRPELPYEFAVVNDSTPNAFALPGGFVAISRGLLVKLDNEAQLAAVLGHEIGHVTARHSVQGIQRGTLFNVALAVLSGVTSDTAYGGLAQQGGQLAAGLLENRYSREQERESDLLGIDYMVDANYDPRGAVQVQELFYRQIEGGAEPEWLAGIFRTHPFSKERMVDNREYIARNYPRSDALPLRPDPFLEATARLRRVEPAYDLYGRARKLEADGNLTAAIETYHEALEIGPKESLIYGGLGLASLKAGDTKLAIRYLSESIRLGGDYFEPWLGRGYAYTQRGDYAAALTDLERSMELLPTVQGGFLLAESYQHTGDLTRARELYAAVAKADPGGKLGRTAAGRLRELGVR